MRIIQRPTHNNPIYNSTIHPVLARCLLARGVDDKAISHNLDTLLPPTELSNIQAFCNLLIEAYNQKHTITVVGDYDLDGATATAVAVRALTAFGYPSVEFVIPDRFKLGYGLSPKLVDHTLLHFPETKLLLTVDNGISSIDGVHHAQKRGLQVAVTDHHLPGAKLPCADVIINPQLEGDSFPSKALAGVGVIFYCMAALREQLDAGGHFKKPGLKLPNLASLLDLVAIGTIADCVPLDYNNRVLVQAGLRRIRKGKACCGIAALIDKAGLSAHQLTSQDISFRIAPKINAAGRMDDMSVGVRCLLADNTQRAYKYANALCDFNTQRQLLQQDMLESALAALDCDPQKTHHGICVKQHDWHQGIIGILASRLKEYRYQPTVVFSHDDHVTLKGSCRSIPGIHMREILAGIAKEHPGILTKYGGHAMAAGLSLPLQAYETFKRAFHTAISTHPKTLFTPTLHIDGCLSPCELNIETAAALEHFGIWGQGFEEPVFRNTFTLHSKQTLKQSHLRMRLILAGHTHYTDALWFNTPNAVLHCQELIPGCQITAYYKLSISRFRMKESLTLHITHLELSSSSCLTANPHTETAHA